MITTKIHQTHASAKCIKQIKKENINKLNINQFYQSIHLAINQSTLQYHPNGLVYLNFRWRGTSEKEVFVSYFEPPHCTIPQQTVDTRITIL